MGINTYGSARSNQIAISVEFPTSLLDMDKNFKKKLPGTMRRIAMEGKSFWKAEAGRKLKSSRLAYQKAIDMKVVDDLSFYLTLSGFLAFSVESGRGAFDMKPGFLKTSSKVRRSGFTRMKHDKTQTGTQNIPMGNYRVIPLNTNHYINMTSPRMFRTVSNNSPADSWMHPGWKGIKLAEEVIKELDEQIIPKHMDKLIKELGK